MSPHPKQPTVDVPQPDEAATLAPAPSTVASLDAVIVPGYEILGELGRGGMGVVYKARHIRLHRLVALKMILSGAHASEADLARFRAEAEAVARLQHPHIVQIYEVGECDGRPFFSLEYIDGGSLADQLQGTPLPARQAAELVKTLAEAMDFAHRQGVLHRDLKPANVLLAGVREEQAKSTPLTPDPSTLTSIPKITDFGLAKQLGGEKGQTASGAILGTPSYMAPEQAGGKVHELGPPADIYALGAILYELLTGRPPFRAATPVDTVLQVLSEEPVPPRRLQAKLPRDLETICLKCLEKEPPKRYPNALALAQDLRRFLHDEPIQARPISRFERGVKWAKRRPAVAGLLLLVCLVTLVGSVVAGLNYREAIDQRTRAEVALGQTEEARQEEKRQRQEADTARQNAVRALADARMNLYFNQVSRAQREYLASNLNRAEDVLDECPRHLRGWEWHYLKRLCHAEERALTLHIAGATAATFSPDRKQLVSAGRDAKHRLLISHLTTGQEVRTFDGPKDPVNCLVFSSDGTRIATASTKARTEFEILKEQITRLGLLFGGQGEVHVWDAATGKSLFREAISGSVPNGLAFRPDGRWLAAADGPSVLVWDLTTSKRIAKLPAQKQLVSCLAFNPAGDRLVTGNAISSRGDQGSEVTLWSFTPEGKASPLRTWAVPGGTVLSLAFDAKGQRLAAGTSESTLKIFDVNQGTDLFTSTGAHATGIQQMAFRPDGKQLATAGLDKLVLLWDLTRGKTTAALRGHRDSVYQVVYTAGGQRLITCSMDPHGKSPIEVKEWSSVDPREGAEQGAGVGLMTQLAFSPDGKWLASAGIDHTVRIWEFGTWKELHTLRGHTFWVSSVAFSPDGKLLASASLDGTARLWDPATGKPMRTFKAPRGGVGEVRFSPKGDRLGMACFNPDDPKNKYDLLFFDPQSGVQTGSYDVPSGFVTFAFSPDNHWTAIAHEAGNKIALIDLRTNNIRYMPERFQAVKSLVFSPDSKLLASGSLDSAVRLWDVATGREVRTLQGHTGWVLNLAFTADGSRLVSASSDFLKSGKGEVKLWETATGRELLTLDGSLAAAFHPDGRTLVACEGDPNRAGFRVWSGQPVFGQSELLFKGHQPSSVFGLAVSPDGKQLASLDADGILKILDLVQDQETRSIAAHSSTLTVHGHSVAWSPDGSRLATAGEDKLVKLWDAVTGQEVRTLAGHQNLVYGITFRGDGRQLVSASEDGTARVWDVETGQEVVVLKTQTGMMSAVFSPDGTRIATGGKDFMVRLWDATSGQELQSWKGHTHAVARVAFHPDGKLLASTSPDETCRIWDVATGKELHVLRGHFGWGEALAFRPDGRLLAVAGAAKATSLISVFETATWREVGVLHGHTNWVDGLAFSPDSRVLYSASRDSMVKGWNVASG